MPGVIAGFMLVFIPAIGEFVIPELLGGPDTLMIGRVLWNEFFSNRDWPVASAVAIAMLFALVIPIMILRGAQARDGGEADARRRTAAADLLHRSASSFSTRRSCRWSIFSFNESQLVTVWGGFSTKWYGELLRDPQILGAAWVSLQVAVVSATARGRARHARRLRADALRPVPRRGRS